MAEFTPFTAEDDDDDEESLKQDRKAEKKASIFGASVLKSSETATNKEVPKKVEGFDRLFAELSFTQKEKSSDVEDAERSVKPEKPEATAMGPTLPEIPEEFVIQTSESIPSAEASPETQPEQVGEVAEADTTEEEPEEVEQSAEYTDATVQAESLDEEDSSQPITPSNPPITTSTPFVTPAESNPAIVPIIPATRRSRPSSIPPTPVVYQQAMSSQNVSNPATPNAASANTAQNMQQEVDDAEYYARQKGRREGVFAGALLGGGIEHFRHKRRERKMVKEFAKTEKAHEKELENVAYEHQKEAANKELREAFERRYETTPESTAPVPVAPVKPEQNTSFARQAEHAKTLTPEEVIEVPKDHQLERSAWLSVEVDAHGKPVENPSFEYGAEYHRERAHEIQTQDNDEKVQSSSEDEKKDQSNKKVGDKSAQGTNNAVVGALITGKHQASQLVQKLPRGKEAVKAVTSPPTTNAGTVGWGAALVVIIIIIAVIIL